MHKIIDYYTNKIIADNLPTEIDAIRKRESLLKEKIRYSKDCTNYNWLLLIEKQ